jgi:hypothetical protein
MIARRDAPTFIDVLDRVLDKGIVIDFDVDVSVAGLSAIGMRGHVVVASIERYNEYASLGDASTREIVSELGEFLSRRHPPA